MVGDDKGERSSSGERQMAEAQRLPAVPTGPQQTRGYFLEKFAMLKARAEQVAEIGTDSGWCSR